MIEVRWHGRGGQGAFTASKILGAAVVSEGGFALSFPSFGPERRGAPVQAFTKIGKQPIVDRSIIKKADYIVYLDETLFTDKSTLDLKKEGFVFVNSKEPEKYRENHQIIALDADKIAEKILGQPVSNTTMLSLLVKQTGIVSGKNVKKVLGDYLSKNMAAKNEKILEEIGVSS